MAGLGEPHSNIDVKHLRTTQKYKKARQTQSSNRRVVNIKFSLIMFNIKLLNGR